jgi:thymidylate synthase (FAD)
MPEFLTKRLTIPAAEEVLDKYFPVLDYGFVALTDYMGGDASVEKSARVSYGAGTRKVSDTRNLLRYLYRHKHTSPFEQVEMQFHIGLPIFVMRQLVRHRTANLNEYSGRYSVMPLMFYTPQREQVSYQSTSNKQGREGILDEKDYEIFVGDLEDGRKVISDNYCGNIRADVSRELARIDLPLSTYTFCYWKMDLRNMLHMIGLRSDPHAQWEIRAFSDVLAGIVQRIAPISFDAFLDYQMDSVSFSQAELPALNLLGVANSMWRAEDTKVVINNCLLENGIKGREADEFWKKVQTKQKRDFSLDLSAAKPPEYFAKMMEEHAVETQN